MRTKWPAIEQSQNKAVTVSPGAENDNNHKSALLLCRPEFSAMRVIQALEELSGGLGKRNGAGDYGGALIKILRDQAKAVQNGSLAGLEYMLVNQATALQSLFTRLIELALYQKDMPNMESFLKLALRAQNQSRATLETLANIKNPPNVAFVKQANIAQNQQVNNEPQAPHPRARENKIQRNELLEVKLGEKLDFGTTGTTGRTHSAMATVGKVNRAKND